MDKKNLKELRAECKAKGLKGYSSMKREDLVGLLAPQLVGLLAPQLVGLLAPQPSEPDVGLNVLSLFCGCGGLDDGFHRNAAFNLARSMDNMKHAVETHNLNFPKRAEVRDVKDLLKPEFPLGFSPDVVIGGPPCQDFSSAGDQTLGDRANLTEVFAQVIRKYAPRYFVMENVPAIKKTGKPVYDKVVGMMKEDGYGLTERVVYMPDYGIPQGRSRLIIIGVKGGKDDELAAALDREKVPVASIQDYMTKYGVDLGLDGKKFIYRHPRTYDRRGVFGIDELYPTVRGVVRKMSPTYKFHEGDKSKDRAEIKEDPGWELVARIQTFPADFKWLRKNNALIVGNAVPPQFSKVLAKIIAEHSN